MAGGWEVSGCTVHHFACRKCFPSLADNRIILLVQIISLASCCCRGPKWRQHAGNHGGWHTLSPSHAPSSSPRSGLLMSVNCPTACFSLRLWPTV